MTSSEHDPAGLVTAVTYPSGARVAIARDAAGRLTEQQTDGFQHLAWSYSMDGNITAFEDLANPNQSQTFAYDALHRLTGADGAYGTLGYAYDPVGNRTQLTEDGNATDYTYAPDSNRLLQAGTESYGYDALGNATQAGALSFTYDAKGRMASVDPGKGQPVTYRVNALGQRSVKTDKKDRLFAYDTAGHLIGEYDDKGAAIREYVYLGDRPLAMVVPGRKGAAVYFIHTDHLGTPKLLTDDSGKVDWEGVYRPFGQVSASGKVEQPLRFPGQYADEESGLHYNYYRDYDPGTGRYIESDPIGLMGGLNTYGYAVQNPVRYTDPAGLNPLCPFLIAADGPAPIGDIACGCLVLATAWAGMNAANQTVTGLGDRAQAWNRCNGPDPENECDGDDDDECYRRWEAEDSECNLWRSLGNRVVNACKKRAADRRTLCYKNGGPSPDEPPPWRPSSDYMN